MVVLDAVRCFFLLYTEKSMSRNTKSQCTAGLLLFGLKHHVRHLRASAARPQLGEPCSCRTSPKPPDPTRLSVGGGGGGKLSEMLLYLIVTGVNSIMVVTLSRNAERMDAMRQRMMIMGHTLPLDS